RIPDRTVVQTYGDHVAARTLHRLRDRDRHFTRLAVSEADLAGAVAHHGQRGETHLPAALDRLGHAVDGDQLLEHPVRIFAIVTIVVRHCFHLAPAKCGHLLAASSIGRLELLY